MKTIITELAEKHGNEWPDMALTELLRLNTIQKLGLATQQDMINYFTLLGWASDTLKAGVEAKGAQG